MRRFLILALFGLLLAACDQAATPPKPAATQAAQGGATQQSLSGATAAGSYPAPDNNAYPAPSVVPSSVDGYPPPSPLTQGPPFTLNTPVRAADAQVTGKGPAGVPVKLVNVARASELIGETMVGNDGVFTINVPSKLIAGDRIALMLGNTAGTKFNPNDFISGPGYEDYPLVGILFASTVVQ